jgi:hypothetical protein
MDLVRLGDVPEWIQAAAGVGALAWKAISQHQREQAIDFILLLQGLDGVDGDELAEALDGNAKLAEVFNRLWTTAAVTAQQEKRRLLARMAVTALAGRADEALLDELRVLADTADALQAYHVDLLARMARPRPGKGQMAGHLIKGAWSEDDLEASSPHVGALVSPILRTLESLGLVSNVGSGTYDNQPSWSVTSYGERLLSFLADE